MEALAQCMLPIDGADEHFIDSVELEAGCGFENVFEDNDPKPEAVLDQADDCTSGLEEEALGSPLPEKMAGNAQHLTDLADIVLYDEFVATNPEVGWLRWLLALHVG